jgi:hypothetical protein
MIRTIILLLAVGFSMSIRAQQLFFLDTLTAQSITAATYDPVKKTLLFFSGNNVFFYPFGSQKQVIPEWYNLAEMATVDAAVNWDGENTLFFERSSYRMFLNSTGTLVSALTPWPGLPAEWNGNLDGAVDWNEDLIFFFYNQEYLVYSKSGQNFVDRNNITQWEGWPQHWYDGIDDAFNPGDGFIYFIRAGEIMPYSIADRGFLNPRIITPTMDGQTAGPNYLKKKNSSAGSGAAIVPAAMVQSGNSNAAPGQAQAFSTNKPQAQPAPNMQGCVTGLPSGGNGLRELQSPIAGDPAARPSSDNLPKGFKISEVKIYATKIWGKDVIAGIQTILKSPSGERKEQSPLGRKTVSEYSFVLDQDECIIGIQGTNNGPSGNFIYSIQVITSKRTSQVYGNKITEPGRESFSLVMPGDGVFNGFMAGINTNMSGIGFKYVGQTAMSDVAQTGGGSANGMGAAAVTAMPLVKPNVGGSAATAYPNTASDLQGEYSDNYEDYTKQLGDDAMWSVQPMPGLDWLGAGFDILKFDPLNPNETKNRKIFRGVVITNSSERAGNKAQYLKPYGTNFGSVNSGSDVDSSSWVTSYQTFANSFAVNASGSVSIPGVASASQSGSYSEMNSTAVGSESIYYFTKILRKIHEIDILPTWMDQFSGQKFRQKLHPSFQADVAGLPVLKGVIPQVNASQMQKGKPLPSQIEQLKGKYLQLIEKYGTHYASHVTWGGQYISRTEIKRADYEKSRMEKMAFMNTAEVSIKKVTVGRTVEVDNSYGSTTGTSKSVFRRQTYVQGGNGETDLDKWRDKVDLTPAPVQLYFSSYADLLNPNMFPADKDIEAKSTLLKIITEKYLVDNMRPPVNGKDDFFRPLPDLDMPGNISVKNDGGYVARFSVSFELNGAMQTKESGSITLGRTLNIDVPIGAKNIKLKVEYYTGWLDNTGIIFEKTFTKPEVKCFKVWGTVISQGHDECK